MGRVVSGIISITRRLLDGLSDLEIIDSVQAFKAKQFKMLIASNSSWFYVELGIVRM